MRGCHATPFQGHLLRLAKRQATFAPSYHFTTDVAADEAWTNLPGGPSESRFSGYYRNDIALWCEGRYKRLQPQVKAIDRVPVELAQEAPAERDSSPGRPSREPNGDHASPSED
jgi:acyl-homoserine lactone acylase PvdQ